MRGATFEDDVISNDLLFQSTPLMRGATRSRRPPTPRSLVSIHAPHARGDPTTGEAMQLVPSFNPRPSCEGRLHDLETVVLLQVSIHAPHARGDRTRGRASCAWASFNPRPSCEGRPGGVERGQPGQRFQSTPLMRGATSSPSVLLHMTCFNPRPSCEGRPR